MTQNLLFARFNEGVKLHQAGDLAGAEAIFREILDAHPDHAHTLHMMGLVAVDTGRFAEGETLVRQAIESQDDVPMFYNTLGRALAGQDKQEEAVASYKAALAQKPEFADCLNNLSVALIFLGRNDEAAFHLAHALTLRPGHLNAVNNIAYILHGHKKYAEAADYYRRALAARPDLPELHYNLALTLQLAKRRGDAQDEFLKAIAIRPDYTDALSGLGTLYAEQGRYAEALDYYKKAAATKSDPKLHVHMGLMLQKQGRLVAAGKEYEHALTIDPDFARAMNNLGVLYDDMEKHNEAIAYFKRALEIDPYSYETLGNLGTTLKKLGRLEESIACFKSGLEMAPDSFTLYTNLLFSMIHTPSVSPEELAGTARQFGERVADPLRRTRPFKNDKNSERKLRIGYCSPDFREHPVDYFIAHLLEFRDRGQFEVYAYSNTMHEDAITDRIKRSVDHWRDIRFLDDDEAADLVEADKIDIFIDLAGHTGHNRLMVFARKPAPVQVTWLGYPATTGMAAIDYRITDPYAEPPGMTEKYNTETLWRLPQIFCCYRPHEKSPDVTPRAPFEENGCITFGCFNNFTKVTNETLSAWGTILEKIPDAYLYLEIRGLDDPKFKAETGARMKLYGLPMDRIILKTWDRANQFVLYNKIDIALDPFPLVGGTTSMDTLWMGVPFVTLAGRSFCSRMGVSILTNAGLPQLVAKTTDDYIRIACNLANDRTSLRKIRENLRAKVAASPVMDQETFVRSMEAAYRDMWRKYCASAEQIV